MPQDDPVIQRFDVMHQSVLLVLMGFIVMGWSACRPAGQSTPEKKEAQGAGQPKTDPHQAESSAPIKWGNEKVDLERLERSIQLASEYMVRSCNEMGRFEYLVHLDPEVKIEPAYNLVRHVGAMMGLAVAHQFKPDERLKQALLRSHRFLKQKSLGPVEEHPEMLTVWSRPEVTLGEHDVQAKLGGAGLGLVALSYLEAIEPGTTGKEDLRKLADFILFMQKQDGSFYATYIPTQGGRIDSKDAWFYAGEAALGLLMLYELDPDPRWLDAANKAVRQLAEGQAEVFPAPPDQWVLQSAARLFPLVRKRWQQRSPPMMEHVVRTCQDMLADQQALRKDPRISGCFAKTGITCSTGTCLEGMLSAWSCLGDDQRLLKEQILRGATAGVSFLLKSQVRFGRHAGAWTFITPLLSPDDARLPPSYRTQAEEIRIDYIQHPLCALISYHRLLKQGVVDAASPVKP